MAESRRVHSNFVEEERELLLQLVTDDISIIECKKTDAATNRKKSKAWEAVLHKFNSQSQISRSIHQLKSLWKRMKIMAKKKASVHRRQQKATGGGPKPASPSDTTQSITDLLPGKFKE